MKQENRKNQDDTAAENKVTRNPFGVADVPDPEGQDVVEFSAKARIRGSVDDANADAWVGSGSDKSHESLEGGWSSRWNGGADSTIPGDTKEKWKEGKAQLKLAGERIYLLFNWSNGARRGLLDARRVESNKLIGRYINLSDPTITRPWTGLLINNQRIDGEFPAGRLDFRR